MSDIPSNAGGSGRALRLAGQIARAFIQSKLTPLVIVAALLFGCIQHFADSP